MGCGGSSYVVSVRSARSDGQGWSLLVSIMDNGHDRV